MQPKNQLFALLLIANTFQGGLAQPHQRKIPLEAASLKYYDTYIKVTYARPYSENDEIFGQKIPFGAIWSPGAQETTEIMLTQDILVANDTLKAGAYSIYAVPEQEEWTIIFNTQVGQWESYRYHEKFDKLRINLPVQKSEMFLERLTIDFADRGVKKTTLNITWGTTQIAIPIEFLSTA